MGMDVSGKNPTAEQGKYFRANVWSWRPLQHLMVEAGCHAARAWSLNDGLGLDTQEQCDLLAKQLEKYLKDHPEVEYSIPVPKQQTAEQAILPTLGIDHHGVFGRGNLSPYRINIEHVRSFITFLRSCGGFEVW